MISLRYSWVESLAEFEELRPSWENLERTCGTSGQFFQTWLWVFTWWKHFEKEYRKLKILVGTRPGGDLALAWPMAECLRGGLRMLEPAGGRLTCLSDVIIDDRAGHEQAEKWLESAWQELLRLEGIDAVSFPAVRSGSRLASFLSRSCGPVMWSERCPEIPVSRHRDFEAFLGGLSKGFRKEIRRARRHFESLGKLEHRINGGDLTAAEAVASIYRFKQDWIDSSRLRSRPVMRDRAREFITEYCERCLAGEGEVRVSALKLDGELLAAGVAFVFQGEQFEYIGGFDHAHRLEGPGKVQLSHSIEHSIASGDRSCNLLLPRTEFKARWTKEGEVVSHHVLALNARGRIYRDLYLRNRPRLKAAYHWALSKARRFQ